LSPCYCLLYLADAKTGGYRRNSLQDAFSMAQYIYTMNRVGKVVPPKREILRDISLSFFPGAKIGVLGLNGAGKSTLLRIMAGVDTEFLGEARPQPGIRIGYLPQEPQLDPAKNVRGNVEEAVQAIKDALERLDALYAEYADPDADFDALAKEQGELESYVQTVDGHNLERQLEVAADALRLPPWEADVSKLSGGEKRRVALCRLLLSGPDMLLLDEPTNHLDAESVAWLERFLHEYNGTVIAITHDRYFLDNVCGWILELDRGHGIPWEGNYSSWLEQKEKRLEVEEKQESARQRAMKAELEWVRSNPKGRHAKSKARLTRFEDLSSQESQQRNETKEIFIPPGPRLGDTVIEAEDLRKAYGDRLLINGLNFNLPRGGIVGVIGPNGAGKTTLFRMLSGQEKPDGGELRIGETVQLAYVDQSRDTLDNDKTAWQEVSDGQDIISVGKFQMPSRAYLSRFNFKGTDQQKLVKELSGGERNRLHLAKLLKSGGNVLLLDEPTNDLDVETLRALEEAILDFPGCVVVISHDRWFLDRIATHMLAFEGDSKVTWFEGNYADYEADRHRRLGTDADQPHRIKYRRLDA
jgi:sulfate-transporting ATPase